VIIWVCFRNAKSPHSDHPAENFNFIPAGFTPQFAGQMNRAVFLDRDGTLIVEKNYLHRPEEVEVFPGAGAALKKLSDAGFKLLVVTNQSGIGRGYFTMADAESVNARVNQELARDGVHFEKTYIAPEAPDQPSRARKPSPQFLFDARDEFNLNLAESFMVGDKLIDLECGWNAGVKKSILVRTGYGAGVERDAAEQIKRAIVVDGLTGMAEWILSQK
jgi:D-glycero-D-manno-heptose 1,7-bisphosphate phosphatase